MYKMQFVLIGKRL